MATIDTGKRDSTSVDRSADAISTDTDGSPDGATAPADLPLGAVCASNIQCGSGACVDGVCCENSCTGQCMACNLANTKGRCTPVPAGLDPREDCPQDVQATCARDGSCDGSGQCRFWAVGTTCADPTCTAGLSSALRTCNGAGICRPAATQTCAPYTCQGVVCGIACATSNDCAKGSYCDAKICKPTLSNGTPCATKDQCSSGFCTDGVCCQVEKCVDTCVPTYPNVCPSYNGFTCAPNGTCRGF